MSDDYRGAELPNCVVAMSVSQGAGSPTENTGVSEPIHRLGHVRALDGIRAVAIISVMGLHAIDKLFPGGFLGVDVFFVLSAFLITSLVLRDLEAGHGTYPFREFYWRRAFRLGPALVLWLAVLAWPTQALSGSLSHVLEWTAGSVLYVGNFLVIFGTADGGAYTHVWSLAVEEQFYFIWPVILVLIVRSGRMRSSAAWLTGALVGSIAIQILASNEFATNYFLGTGHLVPLTAGAVAALAFAHAKGKRLQALLSPAWVGTLALVVLGCCVLFFPPGRGLIVDQTFFIMTGIATAALVLHACWRPASWISTLLAWQPLVWVGQRSYGLYLYHRTLTMLAPELAPGLTLRYLGPIVVGVALVLAEISFRFVERPVQTWGREWRRTRRQRLPV